MEDGVAKTFSVTDGLTHEYNFSIGEDGVLSFEAIAKEEEPDYQTAFEELQSNFETLKNEHEVLQASFENTQSVLDEKNSAIEAFEAQIAELVIELIPIHLT